MQEVAVYEAKTRLSELLAGVERGEQFTITRRGLPVARLIAAGTDRQPPATSQRSQVTATFAQLKQTRRGVVMEGDPKEWAADGRA